MNNIITGVVGQDGSYLAEFLLDKGENVWGLVRRSSTPNHTNMAGFIERPNFHLVEGDITDSGCVNALVRDVQPTYYYNLAAQSHVGQSFRQPAQTFQANTMGVLYALEAIKSYAPDCRFLQASTSEMFGDSYKTTYEPANPHYDIKQMEIKYQDETTPFKPRSPYAVSKMAAHDLIHTYREAYNIFACSSICFNHESERRGEDFVTRKITKWVASFHKWARSIDFYYSTSDDNDICAISGCDKARFPKLRLGNLDAKRDWGYAKDFVWGMHLIANHDKPDDFVLCTGQTHSIRDLLDVAFKQIDIDSWGNYVVVDPKFYRPAEVDYLLGSHKKATEELGWKPLISFTQMIKKMVKHDQKLG